MSANGVHMSCMRDGSLPGVLRLPPSSSHFSFWYFAPGERASCSFPRTTAPFHYRNIPILLQPLASRLSGLSIREVYMHIAISSIGINDTCTILSSSSVCQYNCPEPSPRSLRSIGITRPPSHVLAEWGHSGTLNLSLFKAHRRS